MRLLRLSVREVNELDCGSKDVHDLLPIGLHSVIGKRNSLRIPREAVVPKKLRSYVGQSGSYVFERAGWA